MSATQSGLQKEVIALYRRALRMVRTKPETTRPKFTTFVRYSFKTQAAAISPRQVSAIEHLLRKGKRQVEMYEDPKVRDLFVSNEMREWDARDRRRQ
ncbi:hypothetical protein EIP91_002886 [Steccherinum ochraceum]|uniref:Complex 1 LYR protein domain-containing protein n=1 Tax=Steccherinum ochraceum TaxID=92696 RepID=A0A4R0RNZ8_9APHY|nr:hypothetical protein EIP91_002886 [Steccherinum ochraceum]